MAPRRKGTNRSEAKNSLSLGDLVLAKVKGFPAWPAKISRPEDWERSPDPRKYFVEFFGTAEIAFVAPADIQAFTSELKNKLLVQCQGKTVKYFARAVNEICKAFEGREQKDPGDFAEDIMRKSLSCGTCSTTGGRDGSKCLEHHQAAELEDQAKILKQEEVDDDDGPGDEMHGLERFSRSCTSLVSLDVKRVALPTKEHNSSSGFSVKKGNKMLHKGIQGAVSTTREVSSSPLHREEISLRGVIGRNGEPLCPENDKEERHSKSLDARRSVGVSLTERESAAGVVDDGGKGHPPFVGSFRVESYGVSPKEIKKTPLQTEVVPELKRKVERAEAVQKKMHAAPTSFKRGSSNGSPQLPESRKKVKVKVISKNLEGKIASLDSSGQFSKSETDVTDAKKGKSLVKAKKHLAGSENVPTFHNCKKSKSDNADEEDSEEGLLYVDRGECSQVQSNKDTDAVNRDSHPAKRSGNVVRVDDVVKLSFENRRSNSACFVVENKGDKPLETKKSTMYDNAENHLTSSTAVCCVRGHVTNDDSVLLSMKQQSEGLQATSDCSTKVVGSTRKSSNFHKNDNLKSDYDRYSVVRVISGQRSLCPLGEDRERHKTPVHIESASMSKAAASNVSSSFQKTDVERKSPCHSWSEIEDAKAENLGSRRLDDRTCEDRKSPVNPLVFISNSPMQTEEERPKKVMKKHISISPGKIESQRSSSGVKLTIHSPKNSLGLANAGKLVALKNINLQINDSGSASKVRGGSSKDYQYSGSLNHSSTPSIMCRDMPSSSEKLKVTLKRNLQTTVISGNRHDIAGSAECGAEKDILRGERLGVSNCDKPARLLLESKFTDSVMSMKHLIAAAQAKRKQSHSQALPHDNTYPTIFSTPPAAHGRSPSPVAVIQAFSSGNVVHPDSKAFCDPYFASPSTHAYQLSSRNQIDPEEYEGRVSPGFQTYGGSSSGGTEAAVARDAFEGMIETLSRTRESIGRATRLAIECAKYGIACEVVELLIRKLENEASLHRRIDLFFLVDSITQCSHSQKGIAGASYIPTVQAALPRLLGAAAPPGAAARENHRQCHKVLRLWLERQILPESLLRRYMDDIGVSNDDMTAGFSLRRPSRAERAVDDPLREMEGMLVDEYGSNATFQLPGLLSSHVFEDEEDLPSSPCKVTDKESPKGATNAMEEPETCAVTPSYRHHHILEDVDGELEMEDVSASATSKDELVTVGNSSFKQEIYQSCSHRYLESVSVNQTELPSPMLSSPPLPLGSPPPLPLGSPPPLPPCPSSPPPSPPPYSPSPPPPPPLPSLPPPPPPPLPLPPPLPPPPSLPHPHSLLPYSPPSVHHSSVFQEYLSHPNGNQVLLMAGNAPLQDNVNAAMKSEMVPQQSSCFLATGICHTNNGSSFGYSKSSDFVHNSDMYLTPQASHSNQQLHPGSASFRQLPYHPLPAQTASSHFLHAKPTIQQVQQPSQPQHFEQLMHPQHVEQLLHPQNVQPLHSYSLVSHPNGRKHYATDEQWSLHPSKFNPGNQHGHWMAGGSTPCSGAPLIPGGMQDEILKNETAASASGGFHLPADSEVSWFHENQMFRIGGNS